MSNNNNSEQINEEFSGHYIEWREKRINAIINYFGTKFFQGRSLLEVGCGYADIGSAFHRLGCRVTCSDARPEHLAVASSKHPYMKFRESDLDRDWNLGHFDIILHLGVLYHLRDYKIPIVNACQHCSYLVLETEVADSSDPNFCIRTVETGYDQAANGHGVRPSAAAVERMLFFNGFRFVRHDASALNSGFHQYDWITTESKTWQHGRRRLWFCRKRRGFDKLKWGLLRLAAHLSS